MKKRLFVNLIVLSMISSLFGQDLKSLYEKADNFPGTYENKCYYIASRTEYIRNTSCFSYLTNTPSGKTFFLIDAEKKTKKIAFDHERLATSLSDYFKEKTDRNKLPFYSIKFNEGLKSIRFTWKNEPYECDLTAYKIKKIEDSRRGDRSYWGRVFTENSTNPVASPDKKKEAYISEGNLWIRDLGTGKTRQLSTDGSPSEYYSSNIYWAPDSKKIACCKYRPANIRKLTLIESSPNDQLQPKMRDVDYIKPGDALPIRRPVLFDLEKESSVSVNFAEVLDQFDLRLERWSPNSDYFTFIVNKRGHQEYLIYKVNAADGNLTALVHEKSPTFVWYSSLYNYYLPESEEMLWISERDGWRHLYLYDIATGQVKKQITKGEWIVKSVVYVDEKQRKVIFKGCGKDTGADPYLEKYYSVDINTGKIVDMTPENANHEVTFSTDYKYMIDAYSRADLPPVTVLRSGNDGKVLMGLEKCSIEELLKSGVRLPEVFSAKGRDGKTDIWGIIIRPADFDPQKKYPVLEYIYAGPHDSFVPKSFAGSRYLAAMAELGFIVVQCDGMGTANRSKAFHDVCWKNLKDAGFPDRITWIQSAAQKYPEMDIDNVGIYGTSAGGQSSTGALLFHPNFYKVAVSSCGCHDNRMDKIWWNEQWMGYPIGSQYKESSNTCNADRLKGKLMLIVGEVDDNVDPASTYQLANALIKANKEFELVMIPGAGHTSGEKYGERKRRDFFVKHLLGVDPPEWNKN